MTALRFRSSDPELLLQMSQSDWEKALKFSDRARLTLPLALNCGEFAPGWVRARFDRDLRNSTERWLRIQLAYREAATAFEAEGLEFVVLKGFSHCPQFTDDPRHRAQYDFDFLFRIEDLLQARDTALSLGYHPIVPLDRHPIDHLPTMIRRTGWQWRGDFYDPSMPLSLELHFRVWDEKTEGFAPKGVDDLWERRQSRELDGLRFTALEPADTVAYAALHSLRHLLRGDPHVGHFYELASMLHHSAANEGFWSAWAAMHDSSLRRLEAICFSLAHRWFDCHLPPAAQEEIEHLEPEIKHWLALYSGSPLEMKFHPNKDELWLHWSLLDSKRARLAVLKRRMFPGLTIGPGNSVHIPGRELTWTMLLRSRWRSLKFAASRLLHHARALPPTVASAMKWFGPGLELDGQFWRLLVAEGFFDFGMFVFFFLYNLYLLQLGFNEQFLGLMSAIMTAGNVAGSILSVFALRRFGIPRMLMASFALTAGFSALRAVATSPPVLLVLAGVAGLVSSVWPVALAPAVASVTSERGRPFGFSLVCSSGIAIGIVGAACAGRLPGWIAGLHRVSSGVGSYRASLLIGCAIVLFALWPLRLVKMSAAPAMKERKIHRPNRFVVRFLIAMLVWNLGTGIFNPFRNVFFVRQVHMAVDRIGYVFSWSQIAQVGAVLLAPIAFRRFGMTRGIAGMELATALTLVVIGATTNPLGASLVYCAFMAAQYMSEPGMFTLLMEGVSIAERNSASALNFLVSFAGQAIAASAAGVLLARFGYPPVLTGAAVICATAAFLFRVLVAKPKRDSP